MKVIDIATEIWSELAEDTSTTPTLIGLWLRENIGRLNSLISVDYSIDSTNSEITPELGENEKVIFKQLFIVYYYDQKLRDTLNSASSSSVVELSEGGATVRMLNKNELAKTYVAIKKEEMLSLKELIAAYKINNSAPSQVSGDDTVEGDYSTEAPYWRTRTRY